MPAITYERCEGDDVRDMEWFAIWTYANSDRTLVGVNERVIRSVSVRSRALKTKVGLDIDGSRAPK